MERFETASMSLMPGQKVRAKVVNHHPWGVLAEILGHENSGLLDAWMDVVFAACRDVSRRFGEAHWYGMSCGDGWTAWCVARDGEIVRYYDAYEPEQAIGAPLSEESGYVLPHEDPFPDDAFDGVDPSDTEAFMARWMQVKAELGIPDTCNAALLAEDLSVRPDSLGPGTVVRGRALLALSSCGRELGMPPGALRI